MPTVVLSWFERYLSRVLSMGPIPQHVAVILDGNRRWGIEHGLSPRDGHIQGWVATRKVASFCSALGVQEVTFFVFSLENFNRRQEEVDWLMDLFDEGLDEFLAEPLAGRIHFIGERTMLRESIQRKMSQIEEVSKDKREFIMNLAMVYTCRLDITKSIKKVLTSDGQETKDITVDLLDANMMLPFKSIDMLLRTAGETRLSDFMMWESTHAFLSFVTTKLPAMTTMDLVKSILKYQHFKIAGN